MLRTRIAVTMALLVGLVVIPTTASASPLTFTVDSNGDGADASLDGTCNNGSGFCTLRAAIEEANFNGGTFDTINFSSAVGTITPLAGLPALTDATLIDGSSHPSFVAGSGTPVVTIDGTTAGTGGPAFHLAAGSFGSTIRNLQIDGGWNTGIRVMDNSVIIRGNWLGYPTANSGAGVDVDNADDTVIGGSGADNRNIIANGTTGILLQNASASAFITNNYVGVDPGGTIDVGPAGNGIWLDDAGILTTIEQNVISGAGLSGIEVQQTDNTTIDQNTIGTDVSETTALPNGIGIRMDGDTNGSTLNTISDNLISGNLQEGILMGDTNTDVNSITGNSIGVDGSGGSLGNGFSGINLIGGTNGNAIGGTGVGDGNTIAFNGDDGVELSSAGTGNLISSNSIHNNVALGIDLETSGVDTNDTQDPDTGANKIQNYPVVVAAQTMGANTEVSGTINSEPNTDYVIELFSNAACDASGNGEGANFLDDTLVTTDASGDAAFFKSLSPAVPAGHLVTATATDFVSNDTSEFSACKAVTGAGPGPFPPPPPPPTPSPPPTPTPTPTPTPSPSESPAAGCDPSTQTCGTEGDDEIVVDGDNGQIITGGGNDIIIVNGIGNFVNAGEGNDQIQVIGSNNTIDAGCGNDNITILSNFNDILGKCGNDFIEVSGSGNRIDGGPGADNIIATNSSNILFGGGGGDTIKGSIGIDTINGGPGDDIIFSDFFTGAALSATSARAALQAQGGPDKVDGGGGDDRIEAGRGTDIVKGGTGLDRVFGLDGQDQLRGGNGNDKLRGGDGPDYLVGGGGRENVIDGGPGTDTCVTASRHDIVRNCESIRRHFRRHF